MLPTDEQLPYDSLRDALDRVADGVLVIDAARHLVYANDAISKMLGFAASTAYGQDMFEIFPRLHGTVFAEQYDAARRAQAPVTFTAWYEPSNRWVEVRAFPATDGMTVLLTDITARKRSEDALRQSDQAKEEFLAVLSHELQTPLTSILGWSEMALLHDSLALYQRAVPVIHRNARRQQRLITALLDMSRLLHGCLAYEPRAVAFDSLIAEVAATMAPVAADAGLTLEHIAACEALPVTADPGRIRQCIEQLLSNSIKFTAAGGAVTLRWWRDDANAYFAVADTGRGIAPSALPSLFTPFAQ
ncbi:MAG TPA: PAS domain-containing sensor histidine kinase, partial [Armatimonadota bacterium]|nr:PAS domain-containing sensor histidine kinase [Armatimonadota bacterium]